MNKALGQEYIIAQVGGVEYKLYPMTLAQQGQFETYCKFLPLKQFVDASKVMGFPDDIARGQRMEIQKQIAADKRTFADYAEAIQKEQNVAYLSYLLYLMLSHNTGITPEIVSGWALDQLNELFEVINAHWGTDDMEKSVKKNPA